MPGNGKYIDIDTEVVEGSFMDMRLDFARRSQRMQAENTILLSGLRETEARKR